MQKEPGKALAAVDVGGTFTDLLVSSRGGVTALKVPSTPGAPERAVTSAIEHAGAAGALLVHGSTVATNAILERKGARTAFIATEGSGDIIEIGRQERLHLYRLHVEKPEPLVHRRLPSKCNLELEKGDRLRILTPGGGGWGVSPSRRRGPTGPRSRRPPRS